MVKIPDHIFNNPLKFECPYCKVAFDKINCPSCGFSHKYKIKEGTFQVLPFREWIRKELPAGRERDFLGTGMEGGFTPQDLDLVPKIWFKNNPFGKFMLVELKYMCEENSFKANLGYSKQQLFGLIDCLLRNADPERKVYMGFYIIHYPTLDWYNCEYLIVNDKKVCMEDFRKWLLFEIDITPYGFPKFWWKKEVVS